MGNAINLQGDSKGVMLSVPRSGSRGREIERERETEKEREADRRTDRKK